MNAGPHSLRKFRVGLAGLGLLFVALQLPLTLQFGANAEEVIPLLEYPPVQFDPDASEPPVSTRGVRRSDSLPVWSWVGSDGRMTPWMVDGHVGGLSFVGARGLAQMGGLSAARLHSTLLGLLGLWAIALLASRLAGPSAGLLAAAIALLSTQYLFTFLMVRPDEQLDSLGLLWAVLAFLRHHDTGRTRWFLLGCLLVGVALMAKNTAIWPLAGAVTSALAFGYRPRVSWRGALAGAALAALPLVPQLAYVLSAEGGGAFAARLDMISAPWVGLSPSHLFFSLQHFEESFGHMGSMVAAYSQGSVMGPLIPGVGYALLALVALTIFTAFSSTAPRPIRAFGLALGLTLLLYWMLYYRGASYYLLLAPWIPIALALALVQLWRRGPGRSRDLLMALVGVLAVNSVAEHIRLYEAVQAPEKAMFAGEAQRSAAHWLQDHADTTPYTTTYAMVGVMDVLSEGAVRTRSVWPYFHQAGAPPAVFTQAWHRVFARLGPGHHRFLLSPHPSPVETSEGMDGRWIDAQLEAAVSAAGHQLRVESSWPAPSGDTMLRVVTVEID